LKTTETRNITLGEYAADLLGVKALGAPSIPSQAHSRIAHDDHNLESTKKEDFNLANCSPSGEDHWFERDEAA
jgi:hypothetical protein